MKRDILKPGITLLLAVLLVILLSCSSDEKDNTNNNQAPYATLEDEVFALINARRTSLGLTALQKQTVIADEARKHSVNMANGTVPYGHDGSTDRINTIKLTLTVTGSAENVNKHGNDAQAVVNSWLGSSAHKTNIENPNYTMSGIGVAKSADDYYYYTQIFIKP